MLTQLYIENIAVIEKVTVKLSAGLNVLTGETGAGKSIVIDAINAILGQRTSHDLIRTGASSAVISAVFDSISEETVSALREFGCEPEEDGSLLLQREISASGKGGCRINGRPATVSALKEIGNTLISIHGQNENYELLSPEVHIMYLDSMGRLAGLLEDYRKEYHKLQKFSRDISALSLDEAQKARQIDLLTYQVQELEAADIQPGEMDELTHKRTLFQNSEKIAFALNGAKEAVNGGEDSSGALTALQAAADSLMEAVHYFPEMQGLAGRLQDLTYELDDCASELRDYAAQIEYDPEELSEIEERLDLLHRLTRKYGGSEDEMLTFLDRAREELEAITLSEERVLDLTRKKEETFQKARLLASKLSEGRQKAAKIFLEKVKSELAFLDMPGIRFLVRQSECGLNHMGSDEIQFLISTNPGEPPKPLSKIASGGELSRIMLAVKTVLSGNGSIDTLIFDEIDTGISGSAAQKVGLKLKEVASDRQVICVTHSAQIAALGDEHFLINKEIREGRTYTNVGPLDFEGRKRELSRMIGGVKITDLTLKNAEEMLFLAGFKGEKT